MKYTHLETFKSPYSEMESFKNGGNPLINVIALNTNGKCMVSNI